MALTLDKNFEIEALAASTSDEKDYPIPDGEIWNINKFGSDSNVDGIMSELLYSEDDGVTFIDPWDDDASSIRTLHITKGPPSTVEMDGLDFVGGTDRIIRLRITNDNTTNAAHCSAWFNGIRRM